MIKNKPGLTISVLMAGTACPDFTYREPDMNSMLTPARLFDGEPAVKGGKYYN